MSKSYHPQILYLWPRFPIPTECLLSGLTTLTIPSLYRLMAQYSFGVVFPSTKGILGFHFKPQKLAKIMSKSFRQNYKTREIPRVWSSRKFNQKPSPNCDAIRQMYLQRENNLNPYTSNNSPNPDGRVNTSILFRYNNAFVDRQSPPIFRNFLKVNSKNIKKFFNSQ